MPVQRLAVYHDHERLRGLEVREAESPTDLAAARALVVEGYAPLRSAPAAASVICQELLPSVAGRPPGGQELTFLALLRGEPVATVLLSPVAGAGEAAEAIRPGSALDLFDVPRPWLEVLGKRVSSLSELGELGRFVTRKLPTEPFSTQESLEIARRLFTVAHEWARARGMRALVAIMPFHVRRIALASGIEADLVEEARLAVDREGPAQLFQTYARYWLPERAERSPRLYVWR